MKRGLLMITAVVTIVAAIGSVMASVLTYRSSAIRQRREAEKDVRKQGEMKAASKAEIESAVYGGDDMRLSMMIHKMLSPVVLAGLVLSAGCASKTITVYVPTDRRIESCTNSIGIACKAVPDAVMVEMLQGLQELKELKDEMKVDKRVGK